MDPEKLEFVGRQMLPTDLSGSRGVVLPLQGFSAPQSAARTPILRQFRQKYSAPGGKSLSTRDSALSRVHRLLQTLLGLAAHETIDHLAPLENHQGGNRIDTVTHGGGRAVVSV